MKRLFFMAALVSLACPFICCKAKKNTSKSSETVAVASDSKSEAAVTKYRLIVSFISKGGGTDGKLRTDFTKFVESHSKKPSYTMIQWGREGEADYCFSLKELSEKEQVTFVDDIKNLIGKSDMAAITENSECLHKR